MMDVPEQIIRGGNRSLYGPTLYGMVELAREIMDAMDNPSPDPLEDMEESLRDLLRDSAAAHKRRCAIRQGRREPNTHCHHDWDVTKTWCRKCGLTKFDIMENRWTTKPMAS